MNLKILAPFFLLAVSGQAFAAEGKITISSPANGAVVPATNTVALSYSAILGPKGDHLHLYVDGNRVDILRNPKGTTELAPMPAGKHHICLEVNTKAHVSTGVESCIDIISK